MPNDLSPSQNRAVRLALNLSRAKTRIAALEVQIASVTALIALLEALGGEADRQYAQMITDALGKTREGVTS